jgi:hypothetical protein
MWDAKQELHPLYKESRGLPKGNSRKRELDEAMRVRYGRVFEGYSPCRSTGIAATTSLRSPRSPQTDRRPHGMTGRVTAATKRSLRSRE